MQESGIVKRSVRIAGHATSVSLEAAFWQGLCDIAAARGVSLNVLVAAIDAGRSGNLSSAIRLFVLDSARSGELAGTESRSAG
jgi:predicted DNA-binding ribbon-helix-helix protein